MASWAASAGQKLFNWDTKEIIQKGATIDCDPVKFLEEHQDEIKKKEYLFLFTRTFESI